MIEIFFMMNILIDLRGCAGYSAGIAATEYQSCELSTVELSRQFGKSINGF